ncbi:kinesin-like protein KIF20A isoform X2 [Coregonus clupeaformis]|uniref:kinesin-like protein KIF20A isoform X2 n=1 Tax=Coregonus clupeaformis TaxID=59861 RepID=UPI001E1C9559|nr:kinesin-like protein KIF20A isoform X2 [Coregonus clupeaformis]
MALSMASPCGVLSNEEDGIAVFESTAADIGGRLNGVTLPEISIISPGLEHRPSIREKASVKPGVARQGNGDEGSTDKVRVFLRIRPLTEGEKERGEEEGCVCVLNEESLMLKAPKDSQNMKSAERGVAQSMHKFSFSQIFGPETTQQDFFESTMKEMVRDVLRGESRLLYTYGVTNSGKTYTVQGVGREAGLLPRALVFVFRKLQGRLYRAMDLKPVLYQEVRQLNVGEVRAEEIRRDSLLKEEDGMTSRMRDGTSTWDSGIGGLSITSHIATQLEDSDSVCLEPDSLSHSGGEELEEGVQFSVWVAFYEIYNEFLYDLLDAPPSLQPKKRATLRLSDDKQGNPYVKDLTWVQVCSAEEAWRVLRAGRRNQSFASTHLNHNSSRSHSIFSIRILHVHPEADQGQATHISELSVCDLAGSERCKDQRNGERMKEANNINTSLHTLGRCIAAMRHNQSKKSRAPQVVPFRDCKLTRVLQGFFCGRGRSSMVVNINPCASTYDETLQALKFSAIATQLVHGPSTKTRVAYILALLREPQPHSNDSTLMEEDDDSDGEEGDITMFDSDALLRAIEVLKREVQRQREEKEVLEATIREQVFSEMMEVISGMENDFSQTLETERALLEERFEDKINNLQKSLKRYYNQEMEVRDEQVVALTAALEKGGVALAEPAPLPLFTPLALGESEGPNPRRSQRLASTTTGELSRVRAELDQCRAELLQKKQELRCIQGQLTPPEPSDALTNTANRKLVEGQRNMRQLRLDLQKLGLNLQSGERACCRNTGGERLRHALAAADGTLAKQDQTLVELQNDLLLVKADLRRKAECLAQMQQMPPSATPGSCKKRGCGAGAAAGNTENQPPEKRPFFHSFFPQRTPSRNNQQGRPREDQTIHYSRILRSRLTPPPGPCPSGRYRVTKC